jgi:predicted DNA-binding protein
VKKLMIYLGDDLHEDLKALAFRKRTTMAALVRYALDRTFEDELDVIAGERALEEAARDPSSVMTLEEYLEKRGLALPDRANAKGAARARRAAS